VAYRKKNDFAVQCDLQTQNKTKTNKLSQTAEIINSDLNARLLNLEEEMQKLKQINQSLKQENKIPREKLSSNQSQKENNETIGDDISDIKEKMSDFLLTFEILKKQTENLPSNADMYLLQNEVRNMRKEQADKNNQQTVLTSKPIKSTAAQTTQRSSITTQDMEVQTCAQNAEKQKTDTNRHLNTQQAEI
jgi:hypothetical protein